MAYQPLVPSGSRPSNDAEVISAPRSDLNIIRSSLRAARPVGLNHHRAALRASHRRRANSYGMSFGDGGGLAIIIPLADLAAGRYDRMVTDLSMG